MLKYLPSCEILSQDTDRVPEWPPKCPESPDLIDYPKLIRRSRCSLGGGGESGGEEAAWRIRQLDTNFQRAELRRRTVSNAKAEHKSAYRRSPTQIKTPSAKRRLLAEKIFEFKLFTFPSGRSSYQFGHNSHFRDDPRASVILPRTFPVRCDPQVRLIEAVRKAPESSNASN